MNTRPKATGCIVTYNNADKIEKVVASILEQTRDLDFRLIISDNMSADGTADIIRQKFPQVTVVENHENGGFGKGHNAVMDMLDSVSSTHLRAHETDSYLVCRLLLEKKK